MADLERGLAEVDDICREYVNLEIVLVPRSGRLSTTSMRVVSMENARQIATVARCKCWVLDRLIWSCQQTDQL